MPLRDGDLTEATQWLRTDVWPPDSEARPVLCTFPGHVFHSRLSEQSAQLLGQHHRSPRLGTLGAGCRARASTACPADTGFQRSPGKECLPVQMGGLRSSSFAGSSMPRNGPGTVVKLLWWPRGTPVLFSIKVVDRKGFQGLSWADRGHAEEATWAGRKLNTLCGSWACFYAVCQGNRPHGLPRNAIFATWKKNVKKIIQFSKRFL